MRIKFVIYLIIIALLVLLGFEDHVANAASVSSYLLLNVVIFIMFLNSGKKFSFLSPLNIFGTSFFIHLIFGQLIWILKDIFLFNNAGKPLVISKYYLVIGIVFWALADRKNTLFPKNFQFKGDVTPKFQYSTFSGLTASLIFTYIGSYLYTAGFTVIPILASNIDQARFALMQEKGSRGIGSVFLLAGIHSIYRLRVIRMKPVQKLILYFLFFMPYVFYGGRLLLVLPIIVLALPYIYKVRFSFLNLFKGIGLIIAFLFVVNFFGTIRQFGNASAQTFILYSWGDSFNEFQHSAHALDYGKKDFGDAFVPTFFSSFLPSSVFDAMGLDKDEFYKPIGYLVNQNTIFENSPEMGIRISLFGELYMCSWPIMLLFLLVIFWSIFKVDITFTKESDWSLRKYVCMLTGLFMALSIPYGLSFISMFIQFILFTLLVFKLNLKKA